MAPVRVVAISGSLRANSYSRLAAQNALQGAQEAGAETEYLDLRRLELGFVDTDLDDESLPEGVHTLRKTVKEAEGLILSTPEYHGSFSGVLKNALDLMGFKELEGKMIGLVSVSGGALGGVSALHELRTVGRAVHAWVVPQQCAVPHAYNAFDDNGEPKDERMRERLKEVGRQVARFSALHSSQTGQEFLLQWEKAPENPGG
jgi:FMN reductase